MRLHPYVLGGALPPYTHLNLLRRPLRRRAARCQKQLRTAPRAVAREQVGGGQRRLPLLHRAQRAAAQVVNTHLLALGAGKSLFRVRGVCYTNRPQLSRWLMHTSWPWWRACVRGVGRTTGVMAGRGGGCGRECTKKGTHTSRAANQDKAEGLSKLTYHTRSTLNRVCPQARTATASHNWQPSRKPRPVNLFTG